MKINGMGLIVLACFFNLANLHADGCANKNGNYFGASNSDQGKNCGDYHTYREAVPVPDTSKQVVDNSKVIVPPAEPKKIVEEEKVIIKPVLDAKPCIVKEKPSYIKEDVMREKPVVVKEHIIEKPVVMREHVIHEKRIIKERIIHEVPVFIKERVVHRLPPVFVDVPCGFVEKGYLPCYDDVLAMNKEGCRDIKKWRCYKYKKSYDYNYSYDSIEP